MLFAAAITTHHSTGNYDLNVIQVALHSANFETSWVRASDSCLRLFEEAAESGTRGFLLNRPETACCGLWKSNHWYALTLHENKWYILDSRATSATLVSISAATEHIESLMDEGGHALRVCTAAAASSAGS